MQSPVFSMKQNSGIFLFFFFLSSKFRFILFIVIVPPSRIGECSLTLMWRRSREEGVPPNVRLLPCTPLRRRQKTMLPSSLVPASLYLGPRSNYAQSQGLNRKRPGLVCASAVIKRGAKKGINDLIEEERKGGNHTDSGSGGESMNGAPGTLLEQGIVGLLKCVKILVVLQSRWRLVVRIPSILLFVNPERLLLFLPIALLQKFMGGEKKKKRKITQN